MTRKRKPARPTPAPVLYSLTPNQAEWLARARDTEGGAYVGIAAGPEPCDLVAAGAATYRGTHDPRPCEWTDYYLVPTERGLALLAAARR